MERYEKAAQVWSMLTEAAKNRKVLYYSDIDSSNPKDVGKQYLEPIQSYCILNRLPALTVLVVSKSTGEPGWGFIAAEGFSLEQNKVFNFAWEKIETPPPDKLQTAVKKLPSCGIPEAAYFYKRQD